MGSREPRGPVEEQFNGSVPRLLLTFPFFHTSSSLLFLSFKWFYVLNTHPVLNHYTSCPRGSSLPGSFSTSPFCRQLGGIKCCLAMWFLHTVKIALGVSPNSPLPLPGSPQIICPLVPALISPPLTFALQPCWSTYSSLTLARCLKLGAWPLLLSFGNTLLPF